MRRTPSTNLGKMADSTKDRIGRAIIHILSTASWFDEIEGLKLGLLGANLGLTDDHLKWLEDTLTLPKHIGKKRIPPFFGVRSLSARNIEERLIDKNKLRPKQITVLVKEMGRKHKLPGMLVRETVQSRTEFSLASLTTSSLLGVE